MAQFNTTNTFSNGDLVDAPALNNIIDQATALPGLITDQTSLSGSLDPAADLVLVWDSSASGLRKALVQALPSGVTSVSATIDSGASVLSFTVATPSTTPAFHIGLDNQTANKFLAGPVTGAAATPAFRVLSPADMPFATVVIAAAEIDWNLGSMFTKSLTGNITFTFVNPSPGQTIRVRVIQDASHTVGWPTVRWPGGINPIMTINSGRVDIYTIHFIGGLYYGTFDQDFLL